MSIDRQLTAARDQWRWLDSAAGLSDRNIYFPEVVDDAAEKMPIIMERVTEACEQQYFLSTGG